MLVNRGGATGGEVVTLARADPDERVRALRHPARARAGRRLTPAVRPATARQAHLRRWPTRPQPQTLHSSSLLGPLASSCACDLLLRSDRHGCRFPWPDGSRRALRRLDLASAALLAAAALAQETRRGPAPQTAAASGPSFSHRRARARAAVRELLERNLELRRYREVPDLDDAELARLIAAGRAQCARAGGHARLFRSAASSIRREQGAASAAGDRGRGRARARRTQVADVEARFRRRHRAGKRRGRASRSGEEIRDGWRLPRGRRFTQEDWDDAKTHALRQLIARRYPAGRISYSLADVDAPAHQRAARACGSIRARCSGSGRCRSAACSATTRGWCRGSRACRAGSRVRPGGHRAGPAAADRQRLLRFGVHLRRPARATRRPRRCR